MPWGFLHFHTFSGTNHTQLCGILGQQNIWMVLDHGKLLHLTCMPFLEKCLEKKRYFGFSWILLWEVYDRTKIFIKDSLAEQFGHLVKRSGPPNTPKVHGFYVKPLQFWQEYNLKFRKPINNTLNLIKQMVIAMICYYWYLKLAMFGLKRGQK